MHDNYFTAFKRWLEASRFETLSADTTLMHYLHELSCTPETRLRVKRLGTTFALEHDGPGASGSIIIKNVSLRLQDALAAFALQGFDACYGASSAHKACTQPTTQT